MSDEKTLAGDKPLAEFDRMILNQEWIDQNVVPERPHLVVARMETVD